MGFGAASPAEARAKLEKLKLEAIAAAAAPPTPSKPEDEDAVAKLAQKIMRSSSIEEARQHAREATNTTNDPRLAPLFQSPSKGRDKATPGWPESVEMYLGPTNSGKTHRSLDFLAKIGSGCYAGPLRALAWEVRHSVEARAKKVWGEHPPTVGLWTGEESRDPDAPVLCCTAEVAPSHGNVLVLDEAHWCADPQRGHAWTRLLLAARSGRYRHVRICGPVQSEPLLRRVFEKCSHAVTVHRTQRRSRLHFERDPIADFPSFLQQAKSEKRFVAVVAFSRAAVLSLAGIARKAGARSSVIFGKLPPEARRKQLDDALAGRLDVLVCTDVIGHGINLPLDDVVFAETRKFDGTQRRELYVWEAAQVAGRAGRDELPGRCWYLPRYGANVKLLTKAVKAANGDPGDGFDLDLSKAVLAPDLSALTQLTGSVPSILLLPKCVTQWREELQRSLNDSDDPLDWVKSGDVEELQRRLDILGRSSLVPNDVRKALSASDLWHLARLPVREAHFEDVARAACLGEQVVFGSLDSLVDEQLEDEVQRLGDVLMASRRFPSILVGDDAVDEDDACLAAVACHEALYLYGSRLIGHGVGRQIDDAHLCKVCGQPKGPNSKIKDRQCRRCFAIQDREAAQAARQLARFQRPQATRYATDAAGPPLNYALGPQPTQSYAAGAYATPPAPPAMSVGDRARLRAQQEADARVRGLPPELLRDAESARASREAAGAARVAALRQARLEQQAAASAAARQVDAEAAIIHQAARRDRPLNPQEAEAIAAQVVAARNQNPRTGRRIRGGKRHPGAGTSKHPTEARRRHEEAARERGGGGKPVIRPAEQRGRGKRGARAAQARFVAEAGEIARAANRAPTAPRPAVPTPAYVPVGGVGRGRGGRGRGRGGPPGFI